MTHPRLSSSHKAMLLSLASATSPFPLLSTRDKTSAQPPPPKPSPNHGEATDAGYTPAFPRDYEASLVCTTLDNNRSTILLSKSPHSTSHRSPSSKFFSSAHPSNKRRRFNGTLRPDAVVIDKIFLVRKVAITWILWARLAPVSLGAMSIHTRCSSLIDCTVICRFSLLATSLTEH
ncbi:predicted protein [Lichtheimia corymbifera JMRC:FSU:9682]|uniref:Uncharacterized protein n=1 Tax=Lichtheimia corymbifera JMRC:FSU:9682 TaxID=1263082 RepID=A0A068RYS5_9FUNG|nr:predicted protein [Lichtheimia corymbifera JMRC:FSU:9682]